jgi:hypothetical protein
MNSVQPVQNRAVRAFPPGHSFAIQRALPNAGKIDNRSCAAIACRAFTSRHAAALIWTR